MLAPIQELGVIVGIVAAAVKASEIMLNGNRLLFGVVVFMVCRAIADIPELTSPVARFVCYLIQSALLGLGIGLLIFYVEKEEAARAEIKANSKANNNSDVIHHP